MYPADMRTTINLDADVEAAVDRLRRDHGWGLSRAVNELARRGAGSGRADYAYRPVTYDLALTLDVADVAGALEILDELDAQR